MISVRAAARELNRTNGHIDALLHIAAIFTIRYQKTKEGFELMLATNHLGPFLFTNLLRDRLTPGGRVLTVTAPSTTRIEIDRLLNREHFNAMHSFGATKAANLMFTFELARRGHRWDIRANAFHPGIVKSNLMRETPAFVRFVQQTFGSPPERAAHDLVDLALSPAHAATPRALLPQPQEAQYGLNGKYSPLALRGSSSSGSADRLVWYLARTSPMSARRRIARMICSV